MTHFAPPPDDSDDSDDSDAPWLDARFPLGDGTAETSAPVVCPYCAAEVEVILDPGGGAEQRYVEDCQVCCRPWHLTVTWNEHGAATVRADTEDD